MKKVAITTVALAFSVFASSQNLYTLDKYHGRLAFSVVHFGISHVEGNFKVFDATLKSSKEDFSDAVITLTAQVHSINTEVEMRDNDLRTNWFEAAKYPELTFTSTSFTKVSGNKYKLKGNISFHGVTKPIEFDVLYNGKALNPIVKKYSVGFTINGQLDRRDFNLGGEELLTGVWNEVNLKSNVEFVISQDQHQPIN